MHRTIKLNAKNDTRCILLKNRREEICDIPNEYLQSVVYDINNPDELSFRVPSRISYRGKTLDYLVYDSIKGKMQIILDVNGDKERYIIDDDFDVEEDVDMSWKSGIAYSYEKTLDNKTLLIADGATRQLYRPSGETVDVADGILNWLEQQTQWRVSYCDVDARKDTGLYPATFSINLGNYSKAISKDSVIWSQSLNINVGDNPLNFTVSYPDLKVTKNGVLQTSQSIVHEFEDLPYAITKIECRYTSDSNERYGATYSITYSNGQVEKITKPFVNANGMNIMVNNVRLIYEKGTFEEKKVTKYRFFEQCSTTWYSFLMNDVAEAFDCMFMFDTYNKTIQVYSKENFQKDPKGERTHGLHLNYETGIKKLNKTFKVGEVVTRLYVESPNCSIAEENPLGGEFVECFDYYINNGIMSDELATALTRYNKVLDTKYVEWLKIKNNKMSVQQKLSKHESELTAMQEKLKTENALLTAYIKAGETAKQNTQSTVVTTLEGQITKMLQTIATEKEQVAQYNEQVAEISKAIMKENATDTLGKIFTDEDLVELDDYLIEGSISNDYYTTSYALYRWAIQQVEDMNSLQIEFDMETTDFLKKIIHPQGWQNMVSLGERIIIDDKDVADKDGYVQLYGFTYYPNSMIVTDLKFTNNKEPISAVKTIGDIGRATSQQTNMTNYFKEIWKDSANTNVNVAELMQNGLDLSAQIARGRGDVNKVDISESGIYIIDAKDESKQMYFGSGILCITKDKWKTSELAIDSGGVVAQAVVGKLILGEKIQVGNSEDTFTITGDGLRVNDSKASNSERIFIGLEKQSNGTKKATIRLKASTGTNQLVLSDDGIWQCFQIHAGDSFDSRHSYKVPFYVPAKMQRIDEAKLVFQLDYFRAYSKGSRQKEQMSGGVTSSWAGGQSPTSRSGGGDYVGKSTGLQYFSGKTTTRPYGSANDMYGDRGNIHMGSHYHWFTVPTHSHSISFNIPAHRHVIDIGSHRHDISVTIPAHSHEIVYGIYQFGVLPRVTVKIDGRPVAGLNGVSYVNGSAEFNIASYLNKTNGVVTKGVHTIEVCGASTNGNGEGLGRCSFTILLSGYVNF